MIQYFLGGGGKAAKHEVHADGSLTPFFKTSFPPSHFYAPAFM